MSKITIVEHTSDIGISVIADTLKELFEKSAYGMFSLLVDKMKEVFCKKKLKIKVDGIDPESLLVNWLNELLYVYNTKKMLFSKFKLNIYSDKNRRDKNKEILKLSAEIFGEKIIPQKHNICIEIKSATYHNLKIQRLVSGKYQTQIIFDV